MTATDAQVRLVMRERQKGRTQAPAAVRANLGSRHTAAKYERLGKLPGELQQPRTYRTRTDPFQADWPELVAMLTLDQVHRPGEVLQTDGVWLDHLGVTIQGAAFPHVLMHSVLPYSNWEWDRVAQSESFLTVRLGLQSTLAHLGHVPQVHQTDNTSVATRRLGVADRGQGAGMRGFNAEYLELVGHVGLTPRTILVHSPNENGDVEAANGALQRALAQHLLLRGQRDFASVAASVARQRLWLSRVSRDRCGSRIYRQHPRPKGGTCGEADQPAVQSAALGRGASVIVAPSVS
ncbi:MAG: IS21 family transposase [Dehalococcoidia bacterium]